MTNLLDTVEDRTWTMMEIVSLYYLAHCYYLFEDIPGEGMLGFSFPNLHGLR